MGQSLTKVALHFIFSTKGRAAFIAPDIRDRLIPYLGGICRASQCSLIAGNAMADHVHLLVLLHPTMAPADLVRLLKANSSKWMHETFPGLSEFAWQSGYGLFSVSESSVEAVVQYIRGQEEHHRTRSFQEELIEFLDRHGVAHDPRYVWE